MSWHVLTSLLGCVAQWCLLGFVAFQTRRTRFARVLSALCVTFLAWTYAAAAFQATGGVVWHLLDLGVSPFVPPLGLGLVIAFIGGGRGQWLAWLMVSVAFAALAATGWAALWWVPARRWVASDGWPLVYSSAGKRERAEWPAASDRRPRLRMIDAPTARRLLSDSGLQAPLDLDRERSRMEADVVRQALAACGGNKSEAARLLGISRGTLYNKLRADDERD